MDCSEISTELSVATGVSPVDCQSMRLACSTLPQRKPTKKKTVDAFAPTAQTNNTMKKITYDGGKEVRDLLVREEL